MGRSKEAGKLVKDLTEQELASELIRTQNFLSGYCHSTSRKDMERRLREIKQRIKEDIKMADIKHITAETFEEEVLKSEQPVMVDFYADWCMPCKAFMPVIEKVAASGEGKFKVVKLNIDDAHDIAVKYKVKTIPTLMVFKNGEVSKTQVGRTTAENVTKLFE